MTRSSVTIEKRNVSAARKRLCIQRFDGKCAYPGCGETHGLAVDHILPIWIGGKNSDENLEPLCVPHHAAKTKREATLRAKAKRIEKKASPETRKPSTMKSRGFQKSTQKYQWPRRPFGEKK